jgi:predicted nucleic acid-binding protein
VIIVDTSALIDSLVGPRRSAPRMRELIASGERLVLPALVLYEWWRGPRRAEELAAQEALFPAEAAVSFGPDQAATAARLYRTVSRPRGRELDLAIAAQAIGLDAALWTLNPADFQDIPELRTLPSAPS